MTFTDCNVNLFTICYDNFHKDAYKVDKNYVLGYI